MLPVTREKVANKMFKKKYIIIASKKHFRILMITQYINSYIETVTMQLKGLMQQPVEL